MLDVRQNEHVQNVLFEFGELDALVNCAGIIQRNVEHDPEVFAQTVDINLNGTMRACAAARAGLKARTACIVNTDSMLILGAFSVPAYWLISMSSVKANAPLRTSSANIMSSQVCSAWPWPKRWCSSRR